MYRYTLIAAYPFMRIGAMAHPHIFICRLLYAGA
jgi:ABC-type uncharacterized transport system substrate-binding protein